MGDTTAETQLIAPSVWSNSTLCKPYGTRMHRTYGRAPRTRQSTLHATKATRAKKTYTALLPCCLKPGSNQRPSDLQSDALPTELLRHVFTRALFWISKRRAPTLADGAAEWPPASVSGRMIMEWRRGACTMRTMRINKREAHEQK